jgi:spore coat polysaccharide biosynthesis protein SpsF
VRVTPDCPSIDPELVDLAIAIYGAKRRDIGDLTLEARDFPRGLDTEVLSCKAGVGADRQAMEAPEREHVTPYIYATSRRIRTCSAASGSQAPGGWAPIAGQSTKMAASRLVRQMIETLAPTSPNFSWRDCPAVLAQDPEWPELNRTAKPKIVS